LQDASIGFFGAPGAQIRQQRLRLIVQDHPDKLIQAVVYTDSTEVLREVAIRPGQGRCAVELIDGVATPRNGSSTGHDGKELAH
jgi:hypothetical protein